MVLKIKALELSREYFFLAMQLWLLIPPRQFFIFTTDPKHPQFTQLYLHLEQQTRSFNNLKRNLSNIKSLGKDLPLVICFFSIKFRSQFPVRLYWSMCKENPLWLWDPLDRLCTKAEMLMWVPWAKLKPRDWHQGSLFEDREISQSCNNVVLNSCLGWPQFMFCIQQDGWKPQLPAWVPTAGLTCLPWAWYMKNCSSLICFRFFISPHESSKLRTVTTACLDHNTPTCIKEHFAVQAVPLRWIKASSIRYAERSILAQSKHHCHKSVFWRGNLYCCAWEGKSIIQHQLCATLLLARQISARVCQRGWWQQWAEDGGLPSSHTSGAQGCALQLGGDLVLHTPQLGYTPAKTTRDCHELWQLFHWVVFMLLQL